MFTYDKYINFRDVYLKEFKLEDQNYPKLDTDESRSNSIIHVNPFNFKDKFLTGFLFKDDFDQNYSSS